MLYFNLDRIRDQQRKFRILMKAEDTFHRFGLRIRVFSSAYPEGESLPPINSLDWLLVSNQVRKRSDGKLSTVLSMQWPANAGQVHFQRLSRFLCSCADESSSMGTQGAGC
jgi:hypothetical protein